MYFLKERDLMTKMIPGLNLKENSQRFWDLFLDLDLHLEPDVPSQHSGVPTHIWMISSPSTSYGVKSEILGGSTIGGSEY